MPLYEYHCNNCQLDSEILIKNIHETAECPTCGSKEITKLLSVIGAPIIGEGRSNSAKNDAETCGRPQCARGCMFGN
jgi:putative FmdB family regulatory protein